MVFCGNPGLRRDGNFHSPPARVEPCRHSHRSRCFRCEALDTGDRHHERRSGLSPVRSAFDVTANNPPEGIEVSLLGSAKGKEESPRRAFGIPASIIVDPGVYLRQKPGRQLPQCSTNPSNTFKDRKSMTACVGQRCTLRFQGLASTSGRQI